MTRGENIMKIITKIEEDIDKGSLILVNRQHPTRYETPGELVTPEKNILLERLAIHGRAAADLG